jgi:glutamine synthetase
MSKQLRTKKTKPSLVVEDTYTYQPPSEAEIQMLLHKLYEDEIRMVYATFADLDGVTRGKLVPIDQVEPFIRKGLRFVWTKPMNPLATYTGDEAEFIAMPDVATYKPMVWQPGYARIVCSGNQLDGITPAPLCSRQTLLRSLKRLKDKTGWKLNVGIEPEFYLFKRNDDDSVTPQPNDIQDDTASPGYDFKTLNRQKHVIEEMTNVLQKSGFSIYQIEHEDSAGQYEINYHYADALTTADQYMLFKIAMQSVAEKNNLQFSLMPKPFSDHPGSGLHFHLSAEDEDGNMVWEDQTDSRKLGLSKVAYQFLGGLLHHANALTAICAPTVNSYKRLQIGHSRSGTTWATSYPLYGYNNRTVTARVFASRIEWRIPDGLTNIYLALSALIEAGLDGIEGDIDPGEPVNEDIYKWKRTDFLKRGISRLPQNLGEALFYLEVDDRLRERVGKKITESYINLKEVEWEEYHRYITSWEYRTYLERG